MNNSSSIPYEKVSQKSILVKMFAHVSGGSASNADIPLLIVTAYGLIKGTIDKEFSTTLFDSVSELSNSPEFPPLIDDSLAISLKDVTILHQNGNSTNLASLTVFSDQIIGIAISKEA